MATFVQGERARYRRTRERWQTLRALGKRAVGRVAGVAPTAENRERYLVERAWWIGEWDSLEMGLFLLLEARDKREMTSDAFNLEDVSTFGGNAVMVMSGQASKTIPNRQLSDFLPLRDAGYIALESVREPGPFSGREDRMFWHGAILELAWAYRRWRRMPAWRKFIAALAPDWADVRRVIYTGFFAALLVKGLDAMFWPWLKGWWDFVTR